MPEPKRRLLAMLLSAAAVLLLASPNAVLAFSTDLRTKSMRSVFRLHAAVSSPQDSGSPSLTQATSTRRVALLLCPAQFCVAKDYEELWEHLPSQISLDSGSTGSNNPNTKIIIDRELSRVVPLSRRDWIKVSKQLPTTEFWNANLSVHKTLDWYFGAMEKGLAEILYQNSDVDICLVGHSIGGWVARAYLGGLSR
jgi:hypothetical protein